MPSVPVDELPAQHPKQQQEMENSAADQHDVGEPSATLFSLCQLLPKAAELSSFLENKLHNLVIGAEVIVPAAILVPSSTPLSYVTRKYNRKESCPEIPVTPCNAKVPVQALRWTHRGINAQLAFGDNHEHADESIFKLFEQLFRGNLTPLDVTKEDPLPVFLYKSPDNHLGLYSRRNRRLTAFLMYQALRREELLMVHVLVGLVQRYGNKEMYTGSRDMSGFTRFRA